MATLILFPQINNEEDHFSEAYKLIESAREIVFIYGIRAKL